jgi:hypothetical protein
VAGCGRPIRLPEGNRRAIPDRGLLARMDALVELVAVELLRCVGEGVGLLRAGLTYATWCQQVASTGQRLILTPLGVSWNAWHF